MIKVREISSQIRYILHSTYIYMTGCNYQSNIYLHLQEVEYSIFHDPLIPFDFLLQTPVSFLLDFVTYISFLMSSGNLWMFSFTPIIRVNLIVSEKNFFIKNKK